MSLNWECMWSDEEWEGYVVCVGSFLIPVYFVFAFVMWKWLVVWMLWIEHFACIWPHNLQCVIHHARMVVLVMMVYATALIPILVMTVLTVRTMYTSCTYTDSLSTCPTCLVLCWGNGACRKCTRVCVCGRCRCVACGIEGVMYGSVGS